MKTNKLTNRQTDILQYMMDNATVVLPTYREIAEHFKISVKGAFDHVKAIERKGAIPKTRAGYRRKITEKSA